MWEVYHSLRCHTGGAKKRCVSAFPTLDRWPLDRNSESVVAHGNDSQESDFDVVQLSHEPVEFWKRTVVAAMRSFAMMNFIVNRARQQTLHRA